MKTRNAPDTRILDLSGDEQVQPSLIDISGGCDLGNGEGRLAHQLERVFQDVAAHVPIVKLFSRSCQPRWSQIGSIFPSGRRNVCRMQTLSEIFARNLNALMKLHDWSDAELGRRSGVSNRAIGMYRKRDVEPGIDNVEKIARAFGYPGWELLHPCFDLVKMQDKRFEAVCRAYLSATDTEQRILADQANYILTHHPEKEPC